MANTKDEIKIDKHILYSNLEYHKAKEFYIPGVQKKLKLKRKQLRQGNLQNQSWNAVLLTTTAFFKSGASL